METISLHSNGEVVASVPAMLSYSPTRSIVGLMIGNAGIAALCSPLIGSDTIDVLWAGIARQHREAPITTICVVVVDDEMDRHRGLVATLTTRARAAGITVATAVWTDRIMAHGRWRAYLDTSTGRIPDPRATQLAAIATARGFVTYPSRQAIRRLFAPTASAEALARRNTLISSPLTALSPAAAAHVVDTFTSGAIPESDEDFARLITALNHAPARDVAYRAIDLDDPTPTTLLWQHVLHNVAAPHQAVPATLFAAAQLLRGDGALAAVAIDIARDQQPHDMLIDLFHRAISTGMSPTEFRALLSDAVS